MTSTTQSSTGNPTRDERKPAAQESGAVSESPWLFVCHQSQVGAPGSQLRRSVAGEPVVVTHDDDGTLRVLSAVCQHRGHPLLDGLAATTGSECVVARRMTCPYHGWSYGLGGNLLSAPFMNETTPVAQLRRTIRLPELRTASAHGFVFATLDDDAPAPDLGALADGPAAAAGLADRSVVAFQHQVLPTGWEVAFRSVLHRHGTEAGRLVALAPSFVAVVTPASTVVERLSPQGPDATEVETLILHPNRPDSPKEPAP